MQQHQYQINQCSKLLADEAYVPYSLGTIMVKANGSYFGNKFLVPFFVWLIFSNCVWDLKTISVPIYYHSFYDFHVLCFFDLVFIFVFVVTWIRSYDYTIMKVHMAIKSHMNLEVQASRNSI